TFDPEATSNNLKFYVNGTLDNSIGDKHSISYGNYSLQMGEDPNSYYGSTFAYGGLIDEFRIWNVSRTQTEIQSDWNRTLDTSYAEGANPNLVGYWRFDDGSGSNVTDYSRYKNNGTLPSSNPPQWVSPGSPIRVIIPGDINHDFKVSLLDLSRLANAYGSTLGSL